LGAVLEKYETVITPEMNLGQLAMLLRSKYLKDIVGYNMVRGLPFTTAELVEAAMGVLHND
jgi:2-oxoglutarate ferredoxin oxidoreductase subunit alpha